MQIKREERIKLKPVGYKKICELVVETKAIPEFDGYVVSSDGTVFSKKHGTPLKPTDNGRGYKRVTLWRNGKPKCVYVHRLVANAFIPNPNNLPQVNHKDENKSNNRADNLEWCTDKYNVNYGTCRERISKTKKERGQSEAQLLAKQQCRKPIYMCDVTTGEKIKRFSSLTEAGFYFGGRNKISTIGMAALNSRGMKTAYGYKWVYENE